VRNAEILELINANKRIADLLVRFDFDIARVVDGPCEQVHLASGEPLEMVAGDASGGAFMLVGSGEERAIVYVGSEGEGGLIAKDLRDALALVVGLSNIHDATSFPYGDDGGERLRAWLVQTDEEIREDWPELDRERARIREVLMLPEAESLLESLHLAQADERYRPISDAGDEYESMLRS
jgi:hypothetical protein